ncbi:hypothetical protein Misp01_78850 [Microtetraspora sp. NBRC 13810]|uniref:hypothetical protein n=1 Tax=Microtetraspora sp. NBRC 13810 TaxID=3030990 RepID=UPI0024A520BA|nr:hypothetical protein [Microtetraspora sp. NBRC 13810]GLW12757.1 hypothetical protein Misp01_78850 [Microtetraspora sp. NBRC 13810]
MEPITLSLLALFKLVLGKAALAKLALIVKGLAVTSHGHGLLVLAKSAAMTAQSYGVTTAIAATAQMLIIIGSASAGAAAVLSAKEALQLMAEGDIDKGLKKAKKAYRLAGPVFKVWSPV